MWRVWLVSVAGDRVCVWRVWLVSVSVEGVAGEW